MTLPTTTTLNGCDDDSDMFGPPRSSPPIGYRSRVPMISPKLRQREERKRILQLCAHKLERIKDSETNLRRSVCINNTYCRLTDELRREKQSRYLANLPKSETVPETAHDNTFNPYNSCGVDNSNNEPSNKISASAINTNGITSNDDEIYQNATSTINHNHNHNHNHSLQTSHSQNNSCDDVMNNNNNNPCNIQICTNASNSALSSASATTTNTNSTTTFGSCSSSACSSNTSTNTVPLRSKRHHAVSSNTLDNDLEILDRELSAINSPLLIDPEITQGAEQLEKALRSTRKRARAEDESDRLVREALSQYYIPPQRLISAIEDIPLDLISGGGIVGGSNMGLGSMSSFGMGFGMHMSGLGMGMGAVTSAVPCKRTKLDLDNCNNGNHNNMTNCNNVNDLDLDFDMNPNQKDFEVIMDALRLGTPSPTPSSSDSCGQAAMLLSESASVFHNLVVTSLET